VQCFLYAKELWNFEKSKLSEDDSGVLSREFDSPLPSTTSFNTEHLRRLRRTVPYQGNRKLLSGYSQDDETGLLRASSEHEEGYDGAADRLNKHLRIRSLRAFISSLSGVQEQRLI
jgi:hypothetical protein